MFPAPKAAAGVDNSVRRTAAQSTKLKLGERVRDGMVSRIHDETISLKGRTSQSTECNGDKVRSVERFIPRHERLCKLIVAAEVVVPQLM